MSSVESKKWKLRVQASVFEAVGAQLGISAREVTPTANLRTDLSFSSLDLAAVVDRISTDLGIVAMIPGAGDLTIVKLAEHILSQELDNQLKSMDQQVLRAVLEVSAEVLGVDGVDPADNIIELGGDSLAAIEISDRLSEAFDIDLQIEDVFDHTIAELAVLCANTRTATSDN